jgi:hypothetical protein
LYVESVAATLVRQAVEEFLQKQREHYAPKAIER